MTNYIKKESFFQRKVPMYLLLICALLPTIGLFIAATQKPTIIASDTQPCDIYSSVTNTRIQTYEFARPLLYYDVITEDYRLADLKSKIEAFIQHKKDEKVLTDASVYLKKGGGWMTINDKEQYTQASLGKVPMMIAYLKDAEFNPSILNKQIFFESPAPDAIPQNIKEFALQKRKYYTIKELLHYMIAYSDNDALNLLYQNMNMNTFNQLYVDLKLPIPDMSRFDVMVNVVDYMKFFRILINATYLSNDLSEMALKLLSECTYKDGICRNLDKNTKVVHKFGERVWPDKKELHEFAIVYRGRKSYLLGIMTRGNDMKKLSDVLSGISDIVYKDTTPETPGGFNPSPPMASAK